MTQSTATITYDSSLELGITAARLDHNKTLPATIPDPANPGQEIPNPDLIADNLTYIQLRGLSMLQSWYDTNQGAFRIPTGDWLQRWTAEEKKAIRAMGAANPQIQGWLDRLDVEPVVKLSDPDVVTGVPAICAALEQQGLIPAGSANARAAEITALAL
jgi:hypothetical protein